MKRLSVYVLVLLLLLMPSANAQALQHVADQAGTFTQSQENTLEAKLQAIYDTYTFDVVIVTTNNSQGKSAQMYSADFYDGFRSYSAYPNGLIFSFNFDLGDYYEATRGVAQTLFSDSGEAELENLLRPYFTQKDYYGAMLRYADYISARLARTSQPDESGRMVVSGKMNAPPLSESLQIVTRNYLIFIIGGGLVIGLVIAFVIRSKLLIAKPQNSAEQYSVPGSLNLFDTSDIYLYETVTRTKIQQSSGSGGGGGIRFGSSGGGSYGGRGGKL